MIWTLLWAPMTMVFLAIPAMRLALSVPLDLRSNWIFRMTEDVAGRAEVAAANVRAVLALGRRAADGADRAGSMVGAGDDSLAVLLVEVMIGWLLVEWLMADWRRIPFTCSYIPGKGFVPHMFVKGFASYVVFTLASGLMLCRHCAITRSRWGWRRSSALRRRSAAAPGRRAGDEPGVRRGAPSELAPFRLFAD